MKRRNKYFVYICPYCYSPFTIENKSIYRFKYGNQVFCKESCMTKWKKREQKLKTLNLK